LRSKEAPSLPFPIVAVKTIPESCEEQFSTRVSCAQSEHDNLKFSLQFNNPKKTGFFSRWAMNKLEYSSTVMQSPSPIDEVTILSLTETEQSSSCDACSDVSSVSSDEDNDIILEQGRGSAKDQQPRTIFTSYWSHSCNIGLNRLPLIAPVDGNDRDSVNTYERMLRDYEQAAPYRLHRSQHSMSLPQLGWATRPAPVTTTRKAYSSSVLETKRAPSCLRPRRNKRCLTAGGQVSSSSVRFNDTVEIMEFPSLDVAWAPNGWSTYFS
jgi:hypothetical protein